MWPAGTMAGNGGTGITYFLGGGSKQHLAVQPEEANVIWAVCGITTSSSIKGRVMYDQYDSGDLIVYTSAHSFVTPNDGWTTLYVRLSAITGTVDSSSNAVDGTTWHTLSEDSNNIWWTETHDGPVPELSTVSVEIATDSGGTNIVAGPTNYTGIASAEA